MACLAALSSSLDIFSKSERRLSKSSLVVELTSHLCRGTDFFEGRTESAAAVIELQRLVYAAAESVWSMSFTVRLAVISLLKEFLTSCSEHRTEKSFAGSRLILQVRVFSTHSIIPWSYCLPHRWQAMPHFTLQLLIELAQRFETIA